MGLGLRLTDRFLITDEFAGFPVPELTQRVERMGEHARRRHGLHRARAHTRSTSTSAGSWWTTRTTRTVEQFDRDDHTIAGTFFYRVLPKTSILGEVDYNIDRYDSLRSPRTVTPTPGVSGRREGRPHCQDDGPHQGRLGVEGLRQRVPGGLGRIRRRRQRNLEIPRAFRDPPLRRSRERGVASKRPNYYISNYAGVEVRHFLSERLILRVRGASAASTSIPRMGMSRRSSASGRTRSSRRVPRSSTRCDAGWPSSSATTS